MKDDVGLLLVMMLIPLSEEVGVPEDWVTTNLLSSFEEPL